MPGVMAKGLTPTMRCRSKMSVKENVLVILKSGGSITQLGALKSFGCFRLSSVIHRLREEGHNIETRLVQHPTRDSCTYAEYRINGQIGLGFDV